MQTICLNIADDGSLSVSTNQGDDSQGMTPSGMGGGEQGEQAGQSVPAKDLASALAAISQIAQQAIGQGSGAAETENPAEAMSGGQPDEEEAAMNGAYRGGASGR